MGEKTKVLIVDDDVTFASTLSDILEERGYSTLTVNRGKDALLKISEAHFDVVLMDVSMPEMSGIETYKNIKKTHPDTVVIMMTAYPTEKLTNQALKEGAYSVLFKPFDTDSLVKTIEATRRRGCQVIVVDDDKNTCEMLKDIFEDKGYTVSFANDGEKAIKIAKKKHIHIAFIDLNLPGLNGLEIYLALQEINPKMMAVLMTGFMHEMSDLIDKAIEKGAHSCLFKPFDVKKALDLIEELTSNKKM